MTISEFNEGFTRLVEVFSIAKPEGKAKIYYEELENVDAGIFSKAVKKLIRSQDRFPTISRLLDTIASLTPYEMRKWASCSKCDGFGFVRIGMQTYRGNCIHGNKLSSSIKLAPPEDKKHIELFNQKREYDEVYWPGYWEKIKKQKGLHF